MSCYYDCEDYVSDVPHKDHDTESLYSEDFDLETFILSDNSEEADKTVPYDIFLPDLRLVGMYFYPLPFPHFICIYGFA